MRRTAHIFQDTLSFSPSSHQSVQLQGVPQDRILDGPALASFDAVISVTTFLLEHDLATPDQEEELTHSTSADTQRTQSSSSPVASLLNRESILAATTSLTPEGRLDTTVDEPRTVELAHVSASSDQSGTVVLHDVVSGDAVEPAPRAELGKSDARVLLRLGQFNTVLTHFLRPMALALMACGVKAVRADTTLELLHTKTRASAIRVHHTMPLLHDNSHKSPISIEAARCISTQLLPISLWDVMIDAAASGVKVVTDVKGQMLAQMASGMGFLRQQQSATGMRNLTINGVLLTTRLVVKLAVTSGCRREQVHSATSSTVGIIIIPVSASQFSHRNALRTKHNSTIKNAMRMRLPQTFGRKYPHWPQHVRLSAPSRLRKSGGLQSHTALHTKPSRECRPGSAKTIVSCYMCYDDVANDWRCFK